MTSFCKSSVRGNCYVIPLLCPAILFFIIVSTSCRHIEVRPPAPSVPSKCFSDTGIAFAAFSPSTKAGLGLYIICHGLIAQPLLFHVQFRFQSRFLKHWILRFTHVHLLICPKAFSSSSSAWDSSPGSSLQRKPQCGDLLTSLWKMHGCREFIELLCFILIFSEHSFYISIICQPYRHSGRLPASVVFENNFITCFYVFSYLFLKICFSTDLLWFLI